MVVRSDGTLVCNACGKGHPPSASYCWSCHHALRPDPPPPPEPEPVAYEIISAQESARLMLDIMDADLVPGQYIRHEDQRVFLDIDPFPQVLAW